MRAVICSGLVMLFWKKKHATQVAVGNVYEEGIFGLTEVGHGHHQHLADLFFQGLGVGVSSGVEACA